MLENKVKTYWLLFCFLWIFFIFFQIYSVATSYINSDNAIIGLGADNILKGKFPVFFYGQSYMGTAESFLTAVMFLIFDRSSFSLQLAPFVFAVFFILVMYYLASKILGSPWDLLTISFLLLGPPHFQSYAHASKGGYIETLFFGSLMFLFLYKIIWQKNTNLTNNLNYLGLGLVTGLGFWTNPLILSYVPVVIFFLVLNKKSFFLSKFFIIFLIGYFIGSAPFWVYNVKNNFISIIQMQTSATSRNLRYYFNNFKNVSFNLLPVLLGFQFPNKIKILKKLFLIIVFLVYLIVLYKKKDSLKNIIFLNLKETNGLEIFLIFLPLVIAACVFSRFGSLDVARYLLPLYSSYPLVLSAFIKEFWPKAKFIIVLVLVTYFGFNLFNLLLRLSPKKVQMNLLTEQTSYKVIDFFSQNGIYFVYGDRWISERIAFLSKEKIIISGAKHQRIPDYAVKVNASFKPAFVFNRPQSHFENALLVTGATFQKKLLTFPVLDGEFNYYLVYYDIKRPDSGCLEIPPHNFKIETFSNQINAQKIFDRNISTSWNASIAPEKEAYVKVDLGKLYQICIIEIMPEEFKRFKRNFYGGYQVFVSLDNINWQKVAEIKEVMAPLFFSGPHPFWQIKDGKIQLFLGNVSARYLKIVQADKNLKVPWLIREIFVYEFAGDLLNHSWQTTELLGFLNKIGAKRVLADYWLSSVIRQETTGQIETLKQENEISYEERLKLKRDHRIVDLTDGDCFVVEPAHNLSLEKILQQITTSYQKKIIDSWLVYYDLNFKPGKHQFFWSGTHLLSL